MTQENKQLLFVDLSSRLPYGVKCFHPYGVGELDSIDVEDYGIDVTFKTPVDNYYSIEECKPYLRPMSSMTEEERKDLLVTIVGENAVKYFQVLPDGSIDNTDVAHQDLEKFIMHWINFDSINTTSYIDWLNARHFDYRGLIEKGLAIEAPEGMYNKEDK